MEFSFRVSPWTISYEISNTLCHLPRSLIRPPRKVAPTRRSQEGSQKWYKVQPVWLVNNEHGTHGLRSNDNRAKQSELGLTSGPKFKSRILHNDVLHQSPGDVASNILAASQINKVSTLRHFKRWHSREF